jgi:hypothetical protein
LINSPGQMPIACFFYALPISEIDLKSRAIGISLFRIQRWLVLTKKYQGFLIKKD